MDDLALTGEGVLVRVGEERAELAVPGWDWDRGSDQTSLQAAQTPAWSWEWLNDPSAAPGGSAPAHRRPTRWPALLVVPICAVAPWFVPWPWQGGDAVATSNPSSVIVRAMSEARINDPVPGDRPRAPSDAAVKAITREVAASTGGYDVPVNAAEVKTTPGAYQRVGRIRIPRAGLDVPYGEGVYAKALDRGPGHWPGTPLPGEPGNSVLSGHRNTHTQPFKELDRLKPGDKIIVGVGSDNPVTFRVDNTTIVPEAQFKDFVLRQPKDPAARQVTLFACHPEGNPIFRIVVRASVRR